MRVKIEWLTYSAPGDPVANLTLGGETIGRLYHEGIGYVIVVRGQKRYGYAQASQIARDAKRLWERK